MGPWSRALANHFVDWLGVEARAHWLDVGCGTGALTAAICELGRPESVVACDPSGPFIETASSTLPDKRVSFELASGDHLPERDGGFDIVVSGLVLNFVPDPVRALSAMRRRLGLRGLIAAYVWDYAGGVQFLQHFWQAAVELDASAAELDEARRFTGFGPEALASHFHAAGLGDVEVEGLSVPTVFAGFDDYWQPLLGRTGPAPSYVAALSTDRRDSLREALRERLTPRADADGRIALEARAWAVRGTG
jgi:SAM-dependent methyltransferase